MKFSRGAIWTGILLLACGCLGAAESMTKEQAIELAKQALAARIETATDTFKASRADRHEWADTGLGCPREGAAYLQVPTPGFKVLLEAAGKHYWVHVGASRAEICGELALRPVAVPPAATIPLDPAELGEPLPGSPPSRRLVEQAVADLAGRLSTSPDRVSLAEISRVQWPDSSLGCPRPGRTYLQMVTDGYRIRLRVGQRTYQFHSSLGGPAFLCENPREPLAEDADSD
ncbi:MAG: hypothetical protein ACE5GX_17865 [Thermoanaerobaculia bacterium]